VAPASPFGGASPAATGGAGGAGSPAPSPGGDTTSPGSPFGPVGGDSPAGGIDSPDETVAPGSPGPFGSPGGGTPPGSPGGGSPPDVGVPLASPVPFGLGSPPGGAEPGGTFTSPFVEFGPISESGRRPRDDGGFVGDTDREAFDTQPTGRATPEFRNPIAQLFPGLQL
jgi:hypothetical protein